MYGITFKHKTDENFKEFLDSLGIGDVKVQAILDTCPSQKLDKNGDDYVLTTSDCKKSKELTFKNGVEFEENVTENVTAKTTFTIDGDVLKQVQKFPDGRSLFIDRKFTDNTLLVTLKSSFWDGVAYRHYVAA
ncbi:fatty acid-binding protein 2-like [Aricia agestis]|uniref:fatty acid-binding protein 2-like n=1 Tax=Aricia agestis TaxID=91739 RepID=UPI001C20C2D5|nr:fatty acid-binding protein 2-like [Aricia agestis]